MAFIERYGIWLRWWLFFSITALGTTALFISGIAQKVSQADITRISWLIYAVFAFFSVRIGVDTFRLCRQPHASRRQVAGYHQRSEIGWFVSDMLMTLGMIGTVIGFIYMLGTSFGQVEAGDLIGMRGVLARMSTGMSTALYTTAAGLVCSLLLKLQLFNLAQRLDQLVEAGEK